ncbi:hypothetical protein A9Q84_02325 [Halobacteriovorax marinus]|mgnify:CR=1 FL=1|uniref:4Fe-4S ferredoxin-type domain-containing protein n=1 Tax=Halobacteriovorax marinus TaxID=97084 RepID=A0A1Y5FI59_9BACT|nr:hypothetical protein A9Q84_02325 [Halobacteriovorax marinus]
MILERELYKSIGATRAIAKSLRVYFVTIISGLIKPRLQLVTSFSRGLPELIDSKNCSNCKKCELICPTNCLSIEEKSDQLESFILDVSACIFCGLCSDVCSPKVLTLTDHRPLASHGESLWKIDLMKRE